MICRKIFTHIFLVFTLFSSRVVYANITEQGICEAIKNKQLGHYLLIKNQNDKGVKQFIRHTKKHFCDPRDINDDKENPISKELHTTLNKQNALMYILNAVKSYIYIDEKQGGKIVKAYLGKNQDSTDPIFQIIKKKTGFVDIKIKGLKVYNVEEFWNIRTLDIQEGKLHYREKNFHNYPIECVIHLKDDMSGIRFQPPSNHKDGDGTAGYCYVSAR